MVESEHYLTSENVVEYKRWVEVVARKLSRAQHLPTRYLDDLYSVGLVALVVQSAAYDRSREQSFRAFAYLRVRGAMLDYLRKQGEVTNARVASKLASALEKDTEASPRIERFLDAKKVLDKARELSNEKKTLLADIYKEGHSFEEIGRRFNRSRSWVCRQHKSMIEQLQLSLA